MMNESPKRKRGGQPKAPSERKRNNLTFRVTDKLRDILEAAADNEKRSISEEIEFRLNRDFAWEATKQNINQAFAEAKAQLSTNRIAAIRQAGFQIVREAGGNVTVNVSPELLLAEADGILRSGFIAPEDIDKSPLEITIERAVKRAVENALAEKKKKTKPRG